VGEGDDGQPVVAARGEPGEGHGVLDIEHHDDLGRVLREPAVQAALEDVGVLPERRDDH
jgi:hypothetical protein